MEETPSRQIVPFDNPELVVLRNPVARAKFGLSLVQSKILFEIIAYLKTRPNDNSMTINVGDLLQKIGVETKRVKYYVEEIEEMTKKHLRIPEGDNEEGINYLAVNLLAGARFRIDKDGRGTIDIEISNMLKPYYLEIAKGDFFSYHILNTRVLKSTYSVKLYLLLKSYKRFGKLDIGLDELKTILELAPTDYKQFPDFKKRVLERARTEIQEKNDIFFTYDEVRQFPRNGKSPVVRIVFHIKDNPGQKVRVARLGEEKRAKKAADGGRRAADDAQAADFIEYEEVKKQTNLGEEKPSEKKTTRTKLGGKKAATQNVAVVPTQTNLGVLFAQNELENNILKAKNRAGEQPAPTNLGGKKTHVAEPPQTNLGGSFSKKEVPEKAFSDTQIELLRLFRHFDKEAADTAILDYVGGLAHDLEAILDALIYAQKQGTVKNIYAYLPTILRGKAGHGLAEKARQRARRARQAEAEKQQLKLLKIEIETLFEKIETAKRDIVRGIVATDDGATTRVIGQVKNKFVGTFDIESDTPTEAFREKPLLRSLVLHEFRVLFPAAFEQSAGLTEMENRLAELKNQGKKLDPQFSIG